ncbi:MAG: hypothetical protein ACREAK_00745 [Nitrosarchaeum sp.]
MEFTKVLSPSAAKYKYFALPKKVRDEFPEKDKPFKLKFKNKVYTLHVNNKDCIMLTQLYYAYQFAEGDEVKITQNKNGVFELAVIPVTSM